MSPGRERLLFLGSSCIYPKLAPAADPRVLPAHRPAGADEPTRTPSPRSPGSYTSRQCGGSTDIAGSSAMPTNLYGPGDNYDPQVVPRARRSYPSLPRCGRLRRPERHGLGYRQAAPRVPALGRPRRTPACTCSTTTTTRCARSTSVRARTSRSAISPT